VTELEILRKRRELVVLSAGLQRTTLVRRLDHVGRHPGHAVLGFLTRAATLPILFKVASLVLGRVARYRASPRPSFSIAALVSQFRLSHLLKVFPTLKFFHR
jgi:hypothetical protein